MDFNRLLEGFGVPITVLAVVAWGLTRGARVFWADLVLPFRDKGLTRFERFIDKLDNALDQTLSRHQDYRHAAERHEELSCRILDRVEEMLERMERTDSLQSVPFQSRRKRKRQPPPAGDSTTSPDTS